MSASDGVWLGDLTWPEAKADPQAPGGPGFSGLALSGGGIRSATFALGLVQALAGAGLLGRFDYLSTVSGGGYTGAALTWLRKNGGGLGGDFPFGHRDLSEQAVWWLGEKALRLFGWRRRPTVSSPRTPSSSLLKLPGTSSSAGSPPETWKGSAWIRAWSMPKSVTALEAASTISGGPAM